MTTVDLARTVVVGLGVTGRAVVTSLLRRGHAVAAADDRVESVVPPAGVTGPLVDAGDHLALARLVDWSTAVVPSPGVPAHHRVYVLADGAGRPVVSELDLAATWDTRPIAAVTGTNGKTTVTMLVTSMLNRSGITAEAVGNTDVPLVAAIDDPDTTTEVFVVEASSFRLERVRSFAPRVAAWLNLAPDHLDWHGDVAAYGAAKARIFSNQGPDDIAVVPLGDPWIEPYVRNIASSVMTFGAGGDVGVDGAWLTAHGRRLVAVEDLGRRRPHDLDNAAAAAAIALAMGADPEMVAAELRSFSGLAHRLELVGCIGGIRFHNDSKATAPHATLAALAGFENAVLIAGGRNKGLDLAELRSVAPRLRAVVAIGDAAQELAGTFGDLVPVELAESMEAAVAAGRRLAAPGGDVVLSPACASFDWYSGYQARGDHFRSIVTALEAAGPDIAQAFRDEGGADQQ